MIKLLIWAAIASIIAAIQTLRIGDLKAKLRMPELPPKVSPKRRTRKKRR